MDEPRPDLFHFIPVDNIFNPLHITATLDSRNIMASKEFNVVAILSPKKGKTDEVFSQIDILFCMI